MTPPIAPRALGSDAAGLYLDLLGIKDLRDVHSLHNDPIRQSQVMGYRGSVSESSVEEWIGAWSIVGEGAQCLTVRRHRDGGFLGYVTLTRICRLRKSAELGISIATTGKGVGGRVLPMVGGLAFGLMALRQLVVRVDWHNSRSQRFFARLGFEHLATIYDTGRDDPPTRTLVMSWDLESHMGAFAAPITRKLLSHLLHTHYLDT